MKKVIAFIHIVDHMNMWICKVTSFLIIFAGGTLLFGVIMRYVFQQSVAWEGDVAWLTFVLLSLLAAAYVLRRDGHVRLDVLYGRFSPKRKAIMNVATFIFFILFIGMLTWLTISKAWWSVSVVEKSPHSSFHAPLYPARISLALGCVLLLLQGVAEFISETMSIIGHKIEGRVD